MVSLHFRESSCFLIWLREHALSVEIWVYLLVSAAAIPVSSALLMVFVIPTPPKFTWHSALVCMSVYPYAYIVFGLAYAISVSEGP